MSATNPPRCPFEHIEDPELEAKQIAETTKITVNLLDKRYPPPNERLRGVHPKSHGCVKATFTVNADIRPEFQVGLFAKPGKQFAAIIRFSNAAALVGPDTREAVDAVTHNDVTEHGSRGMAIKVLDVGGEVLIEDGEAKNQDFLMINQPMFAFANTKDYLRLDKILERDNDVADGFFAPLQLANPNLTDEQKRNIHTYMEAENITEEDVLRIKESFRIVKQVIQTTDIGNPMGIQYFSAAPFLFGQDRVMKFSAKPCVELPPKLSPHKPRPDNYLRDALTATLNGNEELSFDFMVQVRDGGDDLGIENASSFWDEARYPFKSVAKIHIPVPQLDVESEENKTHCEKLAFTPWHSLVEHQPIGSINRLRKSVYQASAEHRLEQPVPLPSLIRLLERMFKTLFG